MWPYVDENRKEDAQEMPQLRSTAFPEDEEEEKKNNDKTNSTYETTGAQPKTSLFKCTENFTTKKWKFSDKNSDIFHISAQNTDCGYSLELP